MYFLLVPLYAQTFFFLSVLYLFMKFSMTPASLQAKAVCSKFLFIVSHLILLAGSGDQGYSLHGTCVLQGWETILIPRFSDSGHQRGSCHGDRLRGLATPLAGAHLAHPHPHPGSAARLTATLPRHGPERHWLCHTGTVQQGRH